MIAKKSVRLKLKEAAALVCSMTGKSVLPQELEEALAQRVKDITTGAVPRESIAPEFVEGLQVLQDTGFFSPALIRFAHGHFLPQRAAYLVEERRTGSIPIVVSHYKKGGTGKTTLLANTATLLAQQGFKVLCIDGDPQGTATTLFGVDIEDPDLKTLQHVLLGTTPASQHGIHPKDAVIPLYENAVLDLIPANIELSKYDLIANARMSRERLFELVLRRHAAFFNRYDIVMIDTNPGSNQLNLGLMFPATHVLMPVSLDVPSMKSMHLMVAEAKELIDNGAATKDMIIVGNAYQAMQTHGQRSLQQLRVTHGELMASTVIPSYAAVSRQGMENEKGAMLLVEREPTSAATKRMALLANELAERAIWAPAGLGVLSFQDSEAPAEEAQTSAAASEAA